MSKITKVLIIVISLVILGFLLFSLIQPELKNKLVGPGFTKNANSPEPTIAPPAAPKEIKFKRSTNLKEELEKVNPQVTDEDFF